jgi:hypothetical protein
MSERADRLRRARIDAGFEGPGAAAERFGWNPNSYKSNENGNAPFSFKKAKDYAKAFGVRPEWLYEGDGPMRGDLVPIVGSVGADPSGEVLLALGDRPDAFAPVPPGGTAGAAALLVTGHSMRGVADDGALIYFEDQHTPPAPDMIGEVVVVETDTDEVLIKRLHRGSAFGLYDLESLAGPRRHDVRIRWAARISAIVPPWRAQQVIVRSSSEVAA